MKSALDTARLSSRRHELGLTQAEAAALIGVTQLIGKAESPLLYSVVECCRNYNEEQLKRLMAYLNDLAK